MIIVISDQSFAGQFLKTEFRYAKAPFHLVVSVGLSENPTFDNPPGETFGLHGLVVFEF